MWKYYELSKTELEANGWCVIIIGNERWSSARKWSTEQARKKTCCCEKPGVQRNNLVFKEIKWFSHCFRCVSPPLNRLEVPTSRFSSSNERGVISLLVRCFWGRESAPRRVVAVTIALKALLLHTVKQLKAKTARGKIETPWLSKLKPWKKKTSLNKRVFNLKRHHARRHTETTKKNGTQVNPKNTHTSGSTLRGKANHIFMINL